MAIKEYRLGDISFVKNGNKNKEDQIINGKYNFYTRSKQILRSDDFSIDGDYIIIPGEGIFDPMWNSGKAAIHQRVYYINANEKFCFTKYLYYWWIKNNDILYKNAVGTTVKSLRLRNFLDPKIKLPDLQTQQEIINIIEPKESLFLKYHEVVDISDLNKFKESWSNLINIIEPFEKLINKIDKSINKLLSIGDYVVNLDKNNRKVSIKEICFVNIGSTPSTKNKKFWEGNNPWLNSGSLTNENVVINHSSLISDDAIKSKNLKESKIGNTLISIIEPSINKISLSSKKFFYNQSIANIEARDKNLKGFAFFEIRKNILMLSSLSTGTAQKSINKTDIENFQISISNDKDKNELLSNISNLLINYNFQKHLIRMIINNLIDLFVV